MADFPHRSLLILSQDEVVLELVSETLVPETYIFPTIFIAPVHFQTKMDDLGSA